MNQILLTGATGNIGSHVLYELVNDFHHQNKKTKIFVVIRPTKTKTAKERLVSEVFNKDVVPEKIKEFYQEFCTKQIEVIEGSIDNFTFPASAEKDLLIYHLAASVNLGTHPKAKEEITNINYAKTKAFFEIIKNQTKKLVFVSTAFSRGDAEGLISDDYHAEKEFHFRNYYEEFKMKIEKEVLDFAIQNNFKCTIARPSIVSGRLLDFPKFVTNNYSVFYNFGAFFKKMRALTPELGKIRLAINNNCGLNMLPVDYVAKGVIQAATSNESQINITHTKNLSVKFFVTQMLEKCGITDFEFVNEVPKDLSKIEKLYYNTVGGQLVSYVTSKIHEFESKNIRELLKNIEEPNMQLGFKDLYDFAHDINFDNQNLKLSN